MLFLITGIFGIAIQIILVILLKSPPPIEISCVIVYEIISVLELFICLYTMFYIGERQGALFNLRNSTIDNQNQKEKIKTSHEIEPELFYKFPYLRKDNKIRNNEHLKEN